MARSSSPAVSLIVGRCGQVGPLFLLEDTTMGRVTFKVSRGGKPVKVAKPKGSYKHGVWSPRGGKRK